MNKELAKTIGTSARIARKALRLSQEDAAERINVSVEFYGRIERGASLPSILTFVRIAGALKVSADYLLGAKVSWVPTEDEDSPEVKLVLDRWRKDPCPRADFVLGRKFWMPESPKDSPKDSPGIRRLLRRLRKAKPSALRLVSLLLKALERDEESVAKDFAQKPLSCRSLDVSLELKELDPEEPASYDPRASTTPARR